ncbi:Gfo/Idh/MocA family protein [Roseibium algae]|uniref:Gfo/Idh/MocA family oxidoreductase n=1 Tax=Roseibium algae TaxID=3123038 RepID=A0ABU8TGB3_9HYPH
MKDIITVAVIGAGIGQKHLRAYLQLPQRFKVVSLCDIDLERAAKVVSEEGADPDVVKLSNSFDDLIARDDIDVIDICLPPHLHFDMSIKALEAGKQVICEKPLVSSLKEADLLIEAEKKAKGTLTPVFQYRYGSEVAKLKALIEAGLAGKALVASVETHWNRTAAYYDNPWRGTWKGEQGGAVLGHAIHNHDLLCAFMGPIRQLNAFVGTRVNDIEVEDCASISFQMENGALATSSITLGAATDMSRFRFCFEKLTAESDILPYAPAEGTWSFKARGSEADQAKVDACLAKVPDIQSGFCGFLEALADRLQYGGTNSVTLDDGRRSVELVTAIYQSARTGKCIMLPLSNDCNLYESWQP